MIVFQSFLRLKIISMETKSTTRQSSEKKAYRSYVLARTNSWKDSGDGEKVEKEKGKRKKDGGGINDFSSSNETILRLIDTANRYCFSSRVFIFISFKRISIVFSDKVYCV